MSNYEQLVKALRIHTTVGADCDDCAYYEDCRVYGNGAEKMVKDAAAAIEALQADTAELESCGRTLTEQRDYWKDKAANMEPKRGKWIYKPKDAIEMMFTLPKCSVCGHESSDANNYCPNCGSQMRGEVNERD